MIALVVEQRKGTDQDSYFNVGEPSSIKATNS